MTKVDILGGSKVAHPNSDWLIGLTSQALLMTAQQQNKKGAKRSQAEPSGDSRVDGRRA